MNPKPNFIIIGAQKSGTTSLWSVLRNHPDIYMPDEKEPSFFAHDSPSKKRVSDEEDYLSIFSKVDGELAIGEASPPYLYSKVAAEAIYNFNPETKLIAILRNPVDRAFSNFLHARRAGYESVKSFKKAIDLEEKRIEQSESWMLHYKTKGLYGEQLKRFYKLFKKEKIKVIPFEEFNRNKIQYLREVCSFLEVDSDAIKESSLHTKENVSLNPRARFIYKLKRIAPGIYRRVKKNSFIKEMAISLFRASKNIEPEVRDQLNQYYQADINLLSDMTELDFRKIWKI